MGDEETVCHKCGCPIENQQEEKQTPEIKGKKPFSKKYLVFATVFGISKKVIKQLEMAYTEIRDNDFLASYTYMNMMVNTNFADTFTSAVNTSISSTYSSATGGGGGFSGGGGGGRWTAEEVEADKCLCLIF